ncbi:MFS transporter [Clostridium nigeriense]|uniref:MFS transporter n=1 Tax=Clostridium nigeriense TaxID=1805470 RepID=UPI000832FFF7|nr:MFS transporter [Clostridium nigeriense]
MKKYYGLTTFLTFGVFSILTTFYFPYLNQEIGLTLSEVGRVVSVGALFTLIFQPILSNKFSKSDNKNRFILFYLVLVFTAIIGLMVINKDLTILFAPIYGGILGSLAGIFEVYIEELCIKSKYEFSDIRKWGSIGYAIIVFISGIVINKFGYKILHIIALIMIVSMMAVILFKFKDTIQIRKNNSKIKFIDLFKNRNIILLIVVVFLGMGSYMGLDFAYSSYLVDIVGDVNKANEIYSSSISFRVVIEFFSFMIISKYLINSNSKKCLTIALSIAAIKILLFSTGNVFLIVIGDQLHGIMYGLYLSFLFKYLRDILSHDSIATSFAVLSVLSTGGSNFIYPSIYSLVQDMFGYFGMYLLGFILIIISVVIFFIFLPNPKKISR